MKVVYYIIFFSWYLLSLLPIKILYFFSDILFLLIYYVIRYRRAVVRNNLVNSFPNKTIVEIVKIEKEFYRFFCDYIVETIKLLSISKEDSSLDFLP